MLKKRIIPCLDIQNGRTVKGVRFAGLRDAGDPVELAQKYAAEGADELVFLDITATVERRTTLVQLVERIASVINIPFTVGGGVGTPEDAAVLIGSGADKISINSAAYNDPDLVAAIAGRFGSQCVVVAIDAKRVADRWHVFTSGGRIDTGTDVVSWARRAVAAGAGEVLLTSMDHDGAGSGFALELTRAVCDAVSVPVIASGGAGSAADFLTVFSATNAGAALAAGVFHYNELSLPDLKQYLKANKIDVR